MHYASIDKTVRYPQKFIEHYLYRVLKRRIMQENPFIYIMPILNKLHSFCTQIQVFLKGDLKGR
jgi:hypothetical protein